MGGGSDTASFLWQHLLFYHKIIPLPAHMPDALVILCNQIKSADLKARKAVMPK